MSLPHRLSPIFCLVLAGLAQAEDSVVAPETDARRGADATAAGPVRAEAARSDAAALDDAGPSADAADQAAVDTTDEPSAEDADAPVAGEDAPTVIQADHIEGEGESQVNAEGNVVIEQAGRTVSAERVEYYRDPERVIARGRVRYRQAGLWLSADRFDYSPDTQTGQAHDISLRAEGRGRVGYGQAGRVEFLGPDRYGLDQGRFTTCDPGRQDWYLEAGRIDLDYGRSVGVVNNATLRFKGVPIGWAPWLDFPLNGQRKSGLLAPRIGGVSSGGFDLTIPYYWNIAPNYDLTFNPRYMAQRGLQAGGEFRYLQPTWRGTLRGDFLDDRKRQTDSKRYGVNLSHQQRLSSSLTGNVNYQRVSDESYFADLGDRLSAATQVTLPQEAWIDFASTTHWRGLLRVQRYQTLQDPDYAARKAQMQTENRSSVELYDYARSVLTTPPYWRLPQIAVQGNQPLRWGPTVEINAEWVDFRRDEDQQWVLSREQGLKEQVDGQRFHLYPALSWPFRTPYAYITPRAGWMFTDYRLDRHYASGAPGRQHLTRSLSVFSLDSGMTFEREFAYGGQDYVQTLEPRLYYVNIPYRDQRDIPDFDTSELTFNFAQMFSENRFSGIDKINEANQITFGLTSRFLDAGSGRERLRLSLGQRFYFSDQRVTLADNRAVILPGDVDDNAEGQASKSDILLSASGAVNSALRLDGYAQYNQSRGDIERFALTAGYRPEPGKTLNLGYRYNRNPQLANTYGYEERIRQADVSVQWPVFRQWYVMGRTLYDVHNNNLLEGVAGLEYNAGCWTLRLVGQRYVVSSDRKANSWFLQLELNGLVNIGSNPLDVLRESISGYRKTSELDAGAGSPDAP